MMATRSVMDPQFTTHGKLLEAASLLHLPVSVLVERLGLAPDIDTQTVPCPSISYSPPSQHHRSWQGSIRELGTRLATANVAGRLTPGTTSSSVASGPSWTAHEPLHITAGESDSCDEGVAGLEQFFPSTPELHLGGDPGPGLLHAPAPRWAPMQPGRVDAGTSLSVHIHRLGTPVSTQSQAGTSPDLDFFTIPTTSTSTSQTEMFPTVVAGDELLQPDYAFQLQRKSKPSSSLGGTSDDADDELDSTSASQSSRQVKVETEPSVAANLAGPSALGPCSKVWTLPPRIQRKKKPKPAPPVVDKPDEQKHDGRKRKRETASPQDGTSEHSEREVPKRRGAYKDENMKRNTALTRVLKSCIRCRMNRGRCNPNPENPTGPCLTCLSIRGPTLSKQPCFRYIITDASLYREQKAPYQGFTRRWQTMDLVDIPSTGWASSEVRTITVSPNHVHAPLSFRVRQYIPVEGDLLEEVWMEKAQDRRGEVIEVERRMPVPRWAVLNMSEVAKDMAGYIEHNVATFITGSVATGAYSDESSSGRSIHGTLGGGSAGAGGFDGKGANGDALLWETYMMAFRHMGCAKTEEERSLLVYAFRLWVTCRLCSNPVHICGEETLGGRAVYSNGVSLHEGKVPMPLLMTAQFECINYTTFLRPWSRQVLRRLNELVLAKKREYWFTIYLTLFVLLHSCSMMTRRDEEFARQFGVRDKYANPESIRAHHAGVQTMLAHFHFINKGVIPFSLPHTARGKHELAKAANLTEEQLEFVRRTSLMVAPGTERAARMRYVREMDLAGDDLYWVSMLYDEDWKPREHD